MAHPTGESASAAPRLNFDWRLKVEFYGSNVASDAGLLPFLELDVALGLTEMARAVLLDGRRGKNTRHVLCGLLHKSVFGRLDGYEDVNDADRLALDPAMRWIIGGRAVHDCAASASQMGAFETEWLASDENVSALPNLSGQWIDRVHDRQPPRTIVLYMDSSVSRPTASRKIPPATATSLVPVIIRCSCSTSSVIWNVACFVRATFIRRTVVRKRWSRSWLATEASSSAGTTAPMPSSQTQRFTRS